MMHSTALSLPQLLAATWEAREKKHEFLANKTNSVKKYTVSDDGTLAQKDYYLEGALSWERITDEDNNATDMFNSIFGGF